MLRSCTGKVVFGEVMSAALALSGNGYYDNSWSRGAAMVTSPPLRPAADTASCLISRLAKYATIHRSNKRSDKNTEKTLKTWQK